jgi:hypothetical protein
VGRGSIKPVKIVGEDLISQGTSFNKGVWRALRGYPPITVANDGKRGLISLEKAE